MTNCGTPALLQADRILDVPTDIKSADDRLLFGPIVLITASAPIQIGR
jgi:hypothetical protein